MKKFLERVRAWARSQIMAAQPRAKIDVCVAGLDGRKLGKWSISVYGGDDPTETLCDTWNATPQLAAIGCAEIQNRHIRITNVLVGHEATFTVSPAPWYRLLLGLVGVLLLKVLEEPRA